MAAKQFFYHKMFTPENGMSGEVMGKEAAARIKINELLEAAGWRRFFPGGKTPANVRLELHVATKGKELEALGESFEKTTTGFVDFLLLDSKGFPLIVLAAASEDKDPLVSKEQARKYARSHSCRFVILSNGNLHYFWDLERGDPYIITSFPTPGSVKKRLRRSGWSDPTVMSWHRTIERPGFLFVLDLEEGTEPYSRAARVCGTSGLSHPPLIQVLSQRHSC